MREIIMTMTDGRKISTKLDKTIDEIVKFYFSPTFPTFYIEFLDDIRIPWQEITATVQKVYLISEKEREDQGLAYPLRVQFTLHYPMDDLTTFADYTDGMFDPY